MAADYKVIASINPAINRPVWTEPLYQWDHGITLEITGAEIPTDTPVAFSNQEDYGTALRMVSTTTGGVTSVKIPDALLGEQIMCMGDFRVHAWVTVTNSNSAETIYHIIIPVHARPKPADYTDPGTEDPFADAIEQMQSLANQAQTSATNAAASEQAAEQAEQGAQEALEETQALANTTQQQITTAGQNQIDAIEQAGADQIEDIQNASIDQAEKIAIKPSAEGNPISVTDSADWRFQDFQADGWTEQVQTDGNQLFNYLSIDGQKSVGISARIDEEGYINLTGTFISVFSRLDISPSIPVGKYTLSIDTDISGEIGFTSRNGLFNNGIYLKPGKTQITITTKEEMTQLTIGKQGDGEINMRFRLMLNKGSSALDWEPYSGGYQSPRPEIPSKNLLDYSKINSITSRGITFTNNNDGTFTVNGTATSQAYTAPILIDLEPGTYYVSDNFNNGPNKPRLIVEKREVGSSSGPTYASNNTVTITDTDEVKAYINVANGSTLDNEIVYPMIEKNSIKTSWEPYGTIDAWPQPVKNAAGYGGFDGELQNGLYNSSTGVYGTNNSYVCNRNPIFCRAEEKITVNLKITGEIIIVFYNSNGDYISSNSNSSVSKFSATVPENTAYCNFSARKVPIATITPFDIGEIEVLINDGYPVEFTVHGANLFDASQLATKTQSGATVTNNEDGSFTISGSGNLTGTFSINYSMKKEDIKNIHTGAAKINVETLTEPYFICGIYTADGGVVKNASNYSSTQREFQITEGDIEKLKDGTYRMSFYFFGISGHTIKPGTIRPMAYQDGDGTWEPYKSKTVRLISPRPLTKWDKLEKKDGKWGWNFGGKVLVFDGTENWLKYNDSDKTYGFQLSLPDMRNIFQEQNGFSNYLEYISQGISSQNKSCIMFGTSSSKTIYLRIEKINLNDNTPESFKNWLSEKKSEGKPMYIVYQLAEPEWVELSESEQAAMKALETYYPTTVIQNSINAQMRLQYVADPDHYLEQHYQNKLDTIDTLAERVAALETNTIKEV